MNNITSLKKNYISQLPKDIIPIKSPKLTTINKPLKKSKRCCMIGCRIKLKLTDMSCGCQKYFCSMHRLPHSHNCINLNKCKEELKNKIMEGKCVRSKVDRI